MQRQNIAILGGTGFVGRAIIARLAGQGHLIRVLTRHRERHRSLLVYPTLTMAQGDPLDSGFLGTELAGKDAVINLVGILNERGHDGKGFRRAHVELPRAVVDSCRERGVARLLHMSALNADPQGPSHYLRSKGEAEDLVHSAGGGRLAVTSFRPSVIFGPDDSFLNRFATLLRRVPLVFPLACPGARFQPVYVEDVALAFTAALSDHTTFGQRYDLCGPRTYTLIELVRYVARCCGLRRLVVPLPRWASRAQAIVMEWAPGKPFSRDNFDSMREDSVCRGAGAPFGIRPTPLEDVAPRYLSRDG
jgi:NADH dehydrogenase